jgi:hypothetical protein
MIIDLTTTVNRLAPPMSDSCTDPERAAGGFHCSGCWPRWLCGGIVADHPGDRRSDPVFVPRADLVAELLLEQFRSGPTTRLIPIGLSRRIPKLARAAVSRRLAERLRDPAGQFVAGRQRRGRPARGRIAGAVRPPLPAQSRPSRRNASPPEALRAALQQRLRELQSPLAVVQKRWLPADPTGEVLTLLQTLAGRGPRACQTAGRVVLAGWRAAPCCWPKPAPPATTWPANGKR